VSRPRLGCVRGRRAAKPVPPARRRGGLPGRRRQRPGVAARRPLEVPTGCAPDRWSCLCTSPPRVPALDQFPSAARLVAAGAARSDRRAHRHHARHTRHASSDLHRPAFLAEATSHDTCAKRVRSTASDSRHSKQPPRGTAAPRSRCGRPGPGCTRWRTCSCATPPAVAHASAQRDVEMMSMSAYASATAGWPTRLCWGSAPCHPRTERCSGLQLASHMRYEVAIESRPAAWQDRGYGVYMLRTFNVLKITGYLAMPGNDWGVRGRRLGSD
jgi:hypothetical protein